jgi:hypothetical protein
MLLFGNILRIILDLIGGEDLLCGTHKGFRGFGFNFMSVEEEIDMLEGAKQKLENQLKNINARLDKLRA